MTDDSKGPELDLDAIEERVAKATPGPWEHDTDECYGRINSAEFHVADDVAGNDIEFILAAREDIPALVAALREARATIASLDESRIQLCAEAERAEAAAGQMRLVLLDLRTHLGGREGHDEFDGSIDAALATDAGKGWVSPEQHAEAVRDVAYHHAKAAQAAGVLRSLAERWPQPSGHSGDEESGVHDDDCELCAWQEAQAAVEALPDPERVWVSPEAHAAVVAERDAYKRAKSENDERFQIDALESRQRAIASSEALLIASSALAKAEAERDEARAQVEHWKDCYAQVADAIAASSTGPFDLASKVRVIRSQLAEATTQLAVLGKVADAARACLTNRTATMRWVQIEPDDASDLADAIGELDVAEHGRAGGPGVIDMGEAVKRPRDSEWWDRGMRAAAAKVVDVARRLRKEQQRCAETPDREEDEAGCGCDALADDLDESIAAFEAEVRR